MKKLSIFVLFISSLFAQNPIALIETSKGNIEVELRPDLAPKAVENFITHSKDGYYNGQIFHRVIKDFMIQGGDPTGSGFGGSSIWGKSFEDEFVKDVNFDKMGILAMANSGPNSNGSQFFITTVPTPWLNQKHTIFGYVTKGFGVLNVIEGVQTDARSKPIEPIKIISISIEEE